MFQPRKTEGNIGPELLIARYLLYQINFLNTLPQSWNNQDGEKGEKWKKKYVKLLFLPY
jgi:hypothetical protein